MFSAKNELFTRPSGGFVIPRSLRFRASASAYLNRTFGTPTDVKTQTLSLWIKRGLLGNGAAEYYLLTSGSGGTECRLVFNTNDTFTVFLNNVTYRTTTQVFRDPSAWYHLVFVLDTANATANNRFLIYVNGVVVSAFSTNSAITQNATFSMFSAVAHDLCRRIATSADYLDGYLAEVNLVDGQALTPSSFGATSTTTGVWSPIKYTGTYGNNGFHLDFNSYATQAALGTDTSGNSNTWTVNNCSVTAGVTYDSMIDVPTVTDTGSNYCVLNYLDQGTTTSTAMSDGNLNWSNSSGAFWNGARSTFIVPKTGEWYWEAYIRGTPADVGLCLASANLNTTGYNETGSYSYGALNAAYRYSGVDQGTVATYTAGDTISYYVNAGVVKVYKNNSLIATWSQNLSAQSGDYFADTFTNSVTNTGVAMNFGQRPFTYTPPGSAKSLNTYNLAAASILKGNEYMDATTYTGTGASLSVTNAGGFQPDLVWAKSRSAATDHALYDSVRGTTKQLESNTTTAETTEATGLTAFDSTGFTVGALAQMNTSAATYVGWQWKGGGAAVTNTSGSITSSVSANTAAGQSIVTYTGNGSAGATIGHGLGVAPSFIIVKCRGAAGEEWPVYHIVNGATAYMYLSATSPAAAPNATFWNNTAPTSSVFSVGTNTAVNYNAVTMLAYCFAPIAGYSAFGSYTGNNSADGPFVYLGFRARWVMIKRTDAGTQAWWILDTATGTYNVMSLGLAANDSAAESSGNAWMDITANGFKIRQSGVGANGSGATYIYAAFAENPFNNSLAR